MLPSDISQLKEDLKQARIELEDKYYSALRHVTEIINRSEFLKEEDKTKLLDAIWKK